MTLGKRGVVAPQSTYAPSFGFAAEAMRQSGRICVVHAQRERKVDSVDQGLPEGRELLVPPAPPKFAALCWEGNLEFTDFDGKDSVTVQWTHPG